VAAAIGAVALGGILPMAALNRTPLGPRNVALLADVIVLAGLALAVTGRRIPRAAGVALAAGAGLTLLLFNPSYPYPWSGLTILALMFTGTMLYRAERGEFSRRTAAVIAVAVFALTVAAGLWHSRAWHMAPADARQWDYQWVSSLLLAGATFGIGMAVRHRKVPAALAWLGLVSYSVYLLHPLVLNAYRAIPVLHHSHSLAVQILLAAGLVAVILAGSGLSYRLVEVPMQRYGRRVARALQDRFGSDQITAGAAATVPSPDPGAVPSPDPGAVPSPDPGAVPSPDPGAAPQPVREAGPS
jgi:peptidoglycan/LPS O-acetylase OafA/YrhL